VWDIMSVHWQEMDTEAVHLRWGLWRIGGSETLPESIVEDEDIAGRMLWNKGVQYRGSLISVDNRDIPETARGIDIGGTELRKTQLLEKRYYSPEESVEKMLHNQLDGHGPQQMMHMQFHSSAALEYPQAETDSLDDSHHAFHSLAPAEVDSRHWWQLRGRVQPQSQQWSE